MFSRSIVLSLVAVSLIVGWVAPAGVDRPDSGHHHLLVAVDQAPPLDLPIPRAEHHLHLGDGQSEASVELSPGPHTFDPSHEPLW